MSAAAPRGFVKSYFTFQLTLAGEVGYVEISDTEPGKVVQMNLGMATEEVSNVSERLTACILTQNHSSRRSETRRKDSSFEVIRGESH